jgi:hypothetical protein
VSVQKHLSSSYEEFDLTVFLMSRFFSLALTGGSSRGRAKKTPFNA